MRALKGQIVVELFLWYLSLGLLHGLRRIVSYHYHRLVDAAGSALPVPTAQVGLPVLGGGFYCAQPHTVLFYLLWGGMAAVPVGVAVWALRGPGEEAVFRRWHGGMRVFFLAVLAALLTAAACLALPFVPIGTAVG